MHLKGTRIRVENENRPLKVVGFATALGILLLISSCCAARSMTGTVLDAETGKPIEGAIVLIQWTRTTGPPGLTAHKLYKIYETETDKEGDFRLTNVRNPFVDPPDIVIYKKGYVAWRPNWDFVRKKYRKQFEYKGLGVVDKFVFRDGLIVRLDKFLSTYSREAHSYFMDAGLIGASYGRVPEFSDALGEERKAGREELERKKAQRGEKF